MKIYRAKTRHLAVLLGSAAVLTACASALKATKFVAPAVTVNAVQLSLSEKYSNPTCKKV